MLLRLSTAQTSHFISGYVVGCDIRKMNNTLGFRIIVESQYPLTIVYETIEKALSDLDSFLTYEVDPESLEQAKQALSAFKLESCQLRVRDRAALAWKEILDGTYNFKRCVWVNLTEKMSPNDVFWLISLAESLFGRAWACIDTHTHTDRACEDM